MKPSWAWRRRLSIYDLIYTQRRNLFKLEKMGDKIISPYISCLTCYYHYDITTIIILLNS